MFLYSNVERLTGNTKHERFLRIDVRTVSPATNVQYRKYVTIVVQIKEEKKAAKQIFKKEGNLKR